MNETLQQSIDSINAKIASLTQRMEALKSQNAAMTEEKESQLLETIENLNHDLSLANNQVIELSQRPTGRSAEEIDELVKEIDYCIEQLKK
jgi:chromosome segregation ATPase